MSALCKAACVRLLPLARAPVARTAIVRHMSTSSAPGSSGQGMIYYVFVGVAAAGGGFYLYRTLCSDKARFHDRVGNLENKKKGDSKYSSKTASEADAEILEVAEVSEEIEEATTVEPVAVVTGEVVQQNKSSKEADYPEDESPVDGIHLPADEAVAPQEENATLKEDHVQEAKVEVLEGHLFTAPVDAPESSEEKITTGEGVPIVSFQNPDAASKQETQADIEMASTVEQMSHGAEEHATHAEDLSELSLRKPEMNSEEAI